MKLFPSRIPRIVSTHQFDELFGVELPLPALQRGWLHGRELSQPWHVERIAARLGAGCWFSHFHRDNREPDSDRLKFAAHSIAGFWPAGGFLELQMQQGNQLDEYPHGTLGIYT